MLSLFLLDFGGPWDGPHPGPDHFFMGGPSFIWMLFIGFMIMRFATRHHGRPTHSRRASRPVVPPPDPPADNGPLWPDLDSTEHAQPPSEDEFVPKGKIEHF